MRSLRPRTFRALLAAVIALALGVGAVVAWHAIQPSGAAPVAASGGTTPSPDAPRPARASRSAAPTFSGANGVEARWVVAENKRPGTDAWRIPATARTGIDGFADHTQATPGQQVALYVSTRAATFHVEAYRMGYYGGADARLVWRSATIRGTAQPACTVTGGINMVACDTWSRSLTVPISSAFVQGDYLLKLVGSGGEQRYVPLTVWSPTSTAAYVVENDEYTWQAWNPYGGFDLYQGVGSCTPTYPVCNRARVVSFDRPYGYGQGAGDFLANELPLVTLVEKRGLDVTYAPDIVFDEHPTFLPHHRALLSLGHDECWSLIEREAAVAAQHQHGLNIVYFGASPVLRHVRPQPSPLGPDREVVDYRDGAADPLNGHGDPRNVTGNTWTSAPANWSEVPMVGEAYSGFMEPGGTPVGMTITDAPTWLFAGTGLHAGSVVPGVIESDFDQFDRAVHPANLELFAHSPMPSNDIQTSMPPAFSDMSYWTDPASGAGSFDTGTVAWIPEMPAHPVLQQITGNLLAMVGRGPAGHQHPSVANWQQDYPGTH